MMDQENSGKNRHEDYAIRLLGGKNFYPWLLVFVFMLGGDWRTAEPGSSARL